MTSLNIRPIRWEEYQEAVREIARYVKHSNYTPDSIIGIARGGLVLVSHLSHLLGCRRTGVLFIDRTKTDDVFGIKNNDQADFYGAYIPEKELNRVLLVDDIVGYGTTFMRATSYLYDVRKNADLLKIALGVNVDRLAENNLKPRDVVDFYVWEFHRGTWVVFPWEHDGLSYKI